jgi:hypothetical protein
MPRACNLIRRQSSGQKQRGCIILRATSSAAEQQTRSVHRSVVSWRSLQFCWIVCA